MWLLHREDLKKMYRTCGVEGTPAVFLLADTQITHEAFLEDVNNMLNSGEVPGMFAPDERDRIFVDVRDWAAANSPAGVPAPTTKVSS